MDQILYVEHQHWATFPTGAVLLVLIIGTCQWYHLGWFLIMPAIYNSRNLQLCIQRQGRSLCVHTIDQVKMLFLTTVHFLVVYWMTTIRYCNMSPSFWSEIVYKCRKHKVNEILFIFLTIWMMETTCICSVTAIAVYFV